MDLPNNVVSLDQYRARAAGGGKPRRVLWTEKQGVSDLALAPLENEEVYQEVLFHLIKEQERRRKWVILAASLVTLTLISCVVAFYRIFPAMPFYQTLP